MNKNKLSLLLLLFAFLANAGVLHAQELQTIQKLGLGINGLDLAVEIPLAANITIEPAVGLGPSYDFDDRQDAITSKMGWHWALLEPSVHASVYGKFFYNRDKLMSKGKSLLFNSGMFIGAKVKYVSKPLTSDEYHGQTNNLIVNLNWGGQRNLGKYWIYSYSLGLGYGYNLDYPRSVFYPAFDLKVAYVLPLF